MPSFVVWLVQVRLTPKICGAHKTIRTAPSRETWTSPVCMSCMRYPAWTFPWTSNVIFPLKRELQIISALVMLGKSSANCSSPSMVLVKGLLIVSNFPTVWS